MGEVRPDEFSAREIEAGKTEIAQVHIAEVAVRGKDVLDLIDGDAGFLTQYWNRESENEHERYGCA
ncbi:MAG: hypothetical protein OHK006_06180 [Thermodesulfovibrionales bacterium]